MRLPTPLEFRHGGKVVLAASALSAVAGVFVPGLTLREQAGAFVLAPVAFFTHYAVARLVLPILGGTAVFGTWVATVLFYVVPAGGLLSFLLGVLGTLDGAAAPDDSAYIVAGSLPAACGIAAAARRRIQLNCGIA